MRTEIANLVFPVIRRGLDTQQRLAAGQPVDMDAEQLAFRALLLTEREALAVADFGGDAPRITTRFRGIRYALACWLDETLGRHARWQDAWRQRTLETALFGPATGDNFWEQAELALTRASCDACEAFYLCVQLGFRGAGRESPPTIDRWVTAAKARLAKDLAAPWPAPASLDMALQAPPLRQRDRLRRMVLAVSVPLSVLTPLAAWLLARRWWE